jgi:hypothetical protein
MQILLTLLLALTLFAPKAYAAVSFGSGVYTNICGSGTDASRNLCNQGCNISTGMCSGKGNTVVKFVCDGKLAECRSGEQPFASSYSLANSSCGKTVQIDVFTKNCRTSGGWDCGANDMVDYFSWYSGDCANPTATPTPGNPTATPTPTPAPLQSSCDSLTVVSGDGSMIPATITYKITGSDNKGAISKYQIFYGDGNGGEVDSAETQHKYFSSGTFTVVGQIKDSSGNWKTSASCTKTVTVKPIPIIESHKANCSNVFITQGNQTIAPTNAQFTITGYDNKGAITKYKIDYGDGTSEEKTTPDFNKRYDTAGTYEIKGYILDTENNWQGGANECVTSLYVNTQPMKEQPSTGTPTLFTLLGIGSGFLGLTVTALRKRLI